MHVNKLFIIHATRGRPERAILAAQRMVGGMVAKTPFTYIFSVDFDDMTLVKYRDVLGALDFPYQIIVNDNEGCCQATNRAAELLTDEDLIFVNGDDLNTPVGWDKPLLDFVETIPVNEFLVHLPAGIPNSGNSAILQCLSAALYRRMGFIFYPEYISMFGDTDLYQYALALHAVHTYQGPPIHFIHEHPSFGLAKWDGTYTRTNQPEKFNKGKRLIEERMANNFGLPR